MKARVKATGEIIEVNKVTSYSKDFEVLVYYKGDDGFSYKEEQLDFEDLTQGKADVKEKSLPKDEPDYWEKLTHQAAIGAMQVMLASGVPTSLQYQYTKEADHHNVIADEAVKFAVSLVTKIKNHNEENKVQGNPRG